MAGKPDSAVPDPADSRHANDDRRLSKEEYHQLFELVSDAVILVDCRTGSIVEANAAASALYGYTRAEFMGLKITSLSSEPEKTLRAMEEQRNWIAIRYHRKKDGSAFPVEIVTRHFQRQGRQVHLAAIRDISERKRVEDALRESDDLARRALEVNRTLAEIGRIVSSTLSLESVYDQVTLEIKKIIPSERISIGLFDSEQRIYRIAYTAGFEVPERIRGTTVPLPRTFSKVMEERSGFLLHADEKGFPEEYPSLSAAFGMGIRSVIFAPLFSKDEVIGMLFLGSLEKAYTERDLKVAEDVTRQIGGAVASAQLYAQVRQTEKSLRESEHRFRSVVELNIIGVLFADAASGLIEDANDEYLRIIGRTRQELESGKLNWKVITPPEVLRREEQMFQGMQTEQRLRAFDKEYLRPDGTRVPVMIGGSFLDEDRRRVVAFVLDMTDRKRAEEEKEKLQAQLNQAQKMESIGRLAGGVAHDFNNMLGIIVARAEIAAMKTPPEDPLHQDLQEILKAAHRSADTVRQLLAFARKQTISPMILDLNETVSGMIKMLQRLIGENIELRWVPGKDLGMVRMDPTQVNQILANLIVNSRDAITGVGKITIESANTALDESYCREHGFRPGEYVLLSVSDTGSGMSPAAMEHLFDPFFTTKEVGKGTGLGLATVYGIMKQNNGLINVYSESGHGTTIKMYFPRCGGEPAVLPEKAGERKLPRGTETVLIAEDEGPLLNIARDTLQMQGYTVLGALTPGEALSLAGKHRGEIHLLLADVVMPQMNGRELLEKLQAVCPGVRSLFMSGYTADVVAHQGVLNEGVNFIEKPFTAKALVEKVRDVLDK